MMHTIALVTAAALIVPGIFMAFVPMLPALSYMFVIALVFGIFEGFATVSALEIFLLLSIALLSIAIDYTSGILGAKYGGAHTKSLLWGILGAILGTFLMPPFGSLIGLFIAVLIAELYYKKPREMALRAAGGALVGTAVGIAVNVFLAVVFFGLFIFFVLG